MSSFPSQQRLNLYIHPERGPIQLVELDLMEIEVAVYGSRSAISNPEEERIRQVAQRIKAQCKGVDPQSNLKGIASILTRLTTFHQFQGVVIRLAGSTEGGAVTPSSTLEEVERLKSKADHLEKEVPRLTKLLEIEQQAHRAAKEQYGKLEAEHRRAANQHSVFYDKSEMTINQLQAQVRQREAEINRVRQDADTIVRQHAGVEMQVTQLQQRNADLEKSLADLQARLTERDSELAQHRQNTSQFKRTEDQLRQAIKDREEEIKRLQDRLDTLAASPVGGSDDSDVMLDA